MDNRTTAGDTPLARSEGSRKIIVALPQDRVRPAGANKLLDRAVFVEVIGRPVPWPLNGQATWRARDRAPYLLRPPLRTGVVAAFDARGYRAALGAGGYRNATIITQL